MVVLPDMKFMPLKYDTTEKDLIEYMATHYEENVFLVHLRCKYENEKEWRYITDACSLCNFDDILWLHDWYEGQQHIEYLGITQMKGYKEYRLDD